LSTRQTAKCIALVILLVSVTWTQPGLPVTVELVPTDWPGNVFRWRDVATNLYAVSYQNSYTYEDSGVAVTFESYQDSTFAGHLSATNLKPNFAYQVKIVGKPEGSWGPDGDDAANERIGYAGRWWRVTPNPGNSNDQDYEAHRDDPDYIYEGYLLFDFFVTDRFGSAELGFTSNSSYHVLWWEDQRPRGSCDSPVEWSTVTGYASDPAYDEDVGPVDIGVYAEIERLCFGETTLPEGAYNCRFLLTEESFHQSGEGDGYWASVLVCDTVFFELRGPAQVEPAVDDFAPPSLAACPNPFHLETDIIFSLGEGSTVTLGIYDVEGRPVTMLIAGELPVGCHRTCWNGMDSSCRKVRPGLYFLRLAAGESVDTKKVIVLP
jgi:hypothetical protein